MYELYIKQKVFKITDHYEVMDSNQNPVYRVDQDFRLVGNTVHVSRILAMGKLHLLSKNLLFL